MSRLVLLASLFPGCSPPPVRPPADTGPTGVDTEADTAADEDTSVTDTGAACVPDPLPEGALALTLSPLGGTRDVQAGTASALSVSAIVFGTPTPLDLCQAWAVDPADVGIAVVGDQLVVDAGTPDGTEATVTATIPARALGEDEDVTLSLPVFVYDPALRPWVRGWREVARVDCQTGAERAPEQAIEEILIRAGGTMSVTWTPFEVYVDYWADHGFGAGADPRAGEVRLEVTGGNYVPGDVDGVGSYRMDGEDLVLEDLWLGTPQGGTAPAGCGHRLR